MKDNTVDVKYTYISRNTDGGKYIAWETVLSKKAKQWPGKMRWSESRDINQPYLEEQVPL